MTISPNPIIGICDLTRFMEVEMLMVWDKIQGCGRGGVDRWFAKADDLLAQDHTARQTSKSVEHIQD